MPDSRLTHSANSLSVLGQLLRTWADAPGFAERIARTHVDWETGRLLSAPEDILAALRGLDVLGADGVLTGAGIRLLGRLQVDIYKAVSNSSLKDRFQFDSVIAEGANSLAVGAVNRAVGLPLVLKVLRPAPAGTLDTAVTNYQSIHGIARLVAPIDVDTVPTASVSGDALTLRVIVFPLVRAITLQEHFSLHAPITPAFFETFIRQVGGVLASLEERGLGHGDLHGRNILIRNEKPHLELTLIDPSPGLESGSPIGPVMTDMQWFARHLIDALNLLRHHMPSISLEKHLGARLWSIVSLVLREEIGSFVELLRLMDNNPRYSEWQRASASFVALKFDSPKPLGLLRWEEIADPTQASELFQPYPELFSRVSAFGNSLVVGARGSGKSTYLASLAYTPGVATRLVHPYNVFGVLFSCRQGEFRQFSDDFIDFSPFNRRRVKHILVLKLMRRMLHILASAVERGELTLSGDATALHDFFDMALPVLTSITRIEAGASAQLANLAAGVMRWEGLEVRALIKEGKAKVLPDAELLDEGGLLRFCELVRRCIPQLAVTSFYFLFDDAGEPNIHRSAQRVLNELLLSSNSVYCIKLSAERYSYELEDSGGRALEETHDFTTYDIASEYASESGIHPSRTALRDYFASLIGKRLEHWGYPSDDIRRYLGDQLANPGEAIPVRTLIERLAAGRKNAYYSGWEVVWQLADRTPRNLIEMVSEIFAHGNVQVSPDRGERGTAASLQQPVSLIGARLQDKAIRAVSNRRLRALEFVPGVMTLHGAHVPLGKHLYLCATSFGAVAHRYLTANAGKDRLDERLGIERNDTLAMSADAVEVARALIRFGVFDDSVLNVAFDDRQKKPILVFNRVLCPAFGISFRRDAHLRLSAGMFELFLKEPARFAAAGTKFLRGSTVERGFFDEDQ